VPSETEGVCRTSVRDLGVIQRKVGVVKVDGGDGRVSLASLCDLGGLGVVDEDGQTAEDNGLDLEQIIRVNPD